LTQINTLASLKSHYRHDPPRREVKVPKSNMRSKDWVVVCDGRKALILENRGDEFAPNLRMYEVQEHSDRATRELGTQRPGRVHESVGAARSAVEQTDRHEAAERAFLRALAHRLDIAHQEGKFTRLIMVAPPHALGVLRDYYAQPVRRAIVAEIGKDLVSTPIFEIEKYLIDSPTLSRRQTP
jgi:protein required for attachment to host cells